MSVEVEDLFHAINHQFLQCQSAAWARSGISPSIERETFYVRAVMMWCNVTGHRYHQQEIAYLRQLLAPHSVIFQKIWGTDSDGILDGLEKILHALTRGLGEALERVYASYEEYLKATENLEGGARDEAHAENIAAVRADPSNQDAAEKFLGTKLFEIDGLLPPSLLDDLSWTPGQCSNFIDNGPQSGWPTRLWPRSQRPFLAIGGSHYCFDVHTLFDHVYRVVQRAVNARAPEYRDAWNRAQKLVTEAWPLALLGKLLPGAEIFSSVHYQTRELDERGSPCWCEVDGLVCYADHLFIVEVKAGAFTAAPPDRDVDSYLKSIDKLIFEPVKQGERFLRELNEVGAISLCDQNHNEVGKFRISDFAHITVCAISLDPFTELSARAHHLRNLVGNTGTTPFWALSIGDLMTYSEIIDNPLVFLHFVEKRGQASRSNQIALDDELDHYGMYLKHNCYHLHAEGFPKTGHIRWNGYRTEIDAYFANQARGQPTELPRQQMPALFREIVSWLVRPPSPIRRKASSFLLDCDGRMKEDTARLISTCLIDQARVGRPKPVFVSGPEVRITFWCWQMGILMPGRDSAADHCQASMLAAKEPDRWLMELFFASDGRLWDVQPTLFIASDLTAENKQRLLLRAEILREDRLSRVAVNHKIGPNELCPCGSGKKFKRCCRS